MVPKTPRKKTPSKSKASSVKSTIVAEVQNPATIEPTIEQPDDQPAVQITEPIIVDITKDADPQEEIDKNSEESTQTTETIECNELSTSLCIVVACSDGSEEFMRALWAKYAPKNAIIHIAISDVPIDYLISRIIASPDIPDEFVFVPANCVPLAQVDEADLKLKKLYLRANGSPIHNSRLPIFLSKDICAEILAGDDFHHDPEQFFELCAQSTDVRATEVSYSAGNFVVPIFRANFAPNDLIALLDRKKFATIHTQEAWAASLPIFKELI